MSSFTFSVFFSIMLWITVIVFTVSAAPIPSDQQDIFDFSNSNKDAPVYIRNPRIRQAPERLIDDYSVADDGHDLTSESDIFYVFARPDVPPTEVVDTRKRGGF